MRWQGGVELAVPEQLSRIWPAVLPDHTRDGALRREAGPRRLL